MRIIFVFIIFSIYINLISGNLFCSKSNNPPQEIDIDTSYSINPITYSGEDYTAVQVANKIFLNKSNGKLTSATTGLYSNSAYCPEDFIIPKKEDYESILNQLGTNAYTVLKDVNGFNMEEKTYYVTNTKGEDSFNKIFMYLDGNEIKFIDSKPSDINGDLSQKAVVRCMLDLSSIELEYPEGNEDFTQNVQVLIQINKNKYLNGFLWKVEENIITTSSLEYTFTKSGRHVIEFWGNYINGEIVYLCGYVFVKKKSVSNSQTFGDSQIKKIDTDFEMQYTNKLHFEHSNSPVAPRTNGGYYIAFTDKNKFLHVLSYDKDDNLIKDFNTNEKAYPHDITATDYGFAIYMIEADSTFHSYLNLYNKNFELVNTVQIMNNNPNDDKLINSNLEKQIIRYDSDREPVFGMRFMYRPDNGKLIYSRGRIFLIFAHYNHFIDNGGHTGDTVVTFNDALQDMDFGLTWGSSHSLIQSVTFDEYYFWTAALGDAYPEGIKIEYTSKRDFSNSYDPINKKYNLKDYAQNDSLAGNIKGYHNGSADGKLGGILYFENLGLYCLIYAKTPNVSEDEKNGKNIIYMTTWELSNKAITNIKTIEVKVFETNNVMQVRAGKYGEDKVFIIYSETTTSGGNSYGSVTKGTIPKLIFINILNNEFVVNDVEKDNLLMNTNEDLRTFSDGTLIWATANSDGKLVINKIGTPILDDSYDDIDYILTKNDLVDETINVLEDETKTDELISNTDETDDINESGNEENPVKKKKKKQNDDEDDDSLSTGAKVGIALGVIFGSGAIGVGIYFLIRTFKKKNIIPVNSSMSKSNITVYNKNNTNKKDIIN